MGQWSWIQINRSYPFWRTQEKYWKTNEWSLSDLWGKDQLWFLLILKDLNFLFGVTRLYYNPLYGQASPGPLYIILWKLGLRELAWMLIFWLLLLWVMKFFIPDLGVLRVLPASINLLQANLSTSKWGKFSDSLQPLTVLWP